MGGVDLPTRAIREQIAGAIHLVVQQARFVDGSRKITAITEVIGIEDDGTVRARDHLRVRAHRPGERGKVHGRVPRHRLPAVVPRRLHHHGPRHRRRISYERRCVLDGDAGRSRRRRRAGRVRRRGATAGRRVGELVGATSGATTRRGPTTQLRALYSPLRARDFALRHVGVMLAGLLAGGVVLGSWFYGVVLAAFFALPAGAVDRARAAQAAQGARGAARRHAAVDGQHHPGHAEPRGRLRHHRAALRSADQPGGRRRWSSRCASARRMDEALRDFAARCQIAQRRRHRHRAHRRAADRRRAAQGARDHRRRAARDHARRRRDGGQDLRGQGAGGGDGPAAVRLRRRAAGDRSRVDAAAVQRSDRLGRS